MARDKNDTEKKLTFEGDSLVLKDKVPKPDLDLKLKRMPWIEAFLMTCTGIEDYYEPAEGRAPAAKLADQFRRLLKVCIERSADNNTNTTREKDGAEVESVEFKAVKLYTARIFDSWYRTKGMVDPSVWSEDTWTNCIGKATLARLSEMEKKVSKSGTSAEGAKSNYRRGETSSSAHSQKQGTKEAKEGATSTSGGGARKWRCCWCGSTAHRYGDCPGAESGSNTICKKQGKFWKDDNGNEYCLGYNGHREGCTRGTACRFTHSCSLCGTAGHTAQECRKCKAT